MPMVQQQQWLQQEGRGCGAQTAHLHWPDSFHVVGTNVGMLSFDILLPGNLVIVKIDNELEQLIVVIDCFDDHLNPRSLEMTSIQHMHEERLQGRKREGLMVDALLRFSRVQEGLRDEGTQQPL